MKNLLTGGMVNYYLVEVKAPQREGQAPYQAECEDIIQALGMTFDEGCAFKSLWRTAAQRQGNGKPGQEVFYDREKLVHYAGRLLKQAKGSELSTEVANALSKAERRYYAFNDFLMKYPTYPVRKYNL